MGKDFRFFVTPFKDEALSSFLKRNSELRGERIFRAGVTATETEIVYKGFRGKFRDAYPYDGLLENHTLLPMAKKFSIARRFTPGPIASTREWKICWQCVVSDYEEHGTPYHHRQHAAFGVGYCYKHDVVLVAFCDSCQRPTVNHRIHELHDCASEIEFARLEKGSEVQLRFSKYVNELLIAEPDLYGFHGMQGFVRERLRELGYSNNGEVDFKKVEFMLHLSLGRFYGKDEKNRPQISGIGPSLSNWSRITFLAFGTAEHYISALKDANEKHSARPAKSTF